MRQCTNPQMILSYRTLFPSIHMGCGTRDGWHAVLVADRPSPTYRHLGSGSGTLQLLQDIIMRDTQNVPGTKLAPVFFQLPEPCIAQHSQQPAHWFSTPLSSLHRKQSTYFQQTPATIRSQLCLDAVPKGDLWSARLRSLCEGWFIGCLQTDWGRASFSFSLYYLLKNFSF